jgi:hypothetical protein
MPTATSLSGYSLTNNGPLTTTFTAPASCSTAYETMLGAATDPTFLQWEAQCEWLPPADCNPSGSAIQSIDSSAEGGNPTAGMIIVYHSPGLVCPSGWATVGAAAKLNPTSTSISGAFNQSAAIPTDYQSGFFEPELDVFLEALDPGEIAVVCCPRFAPFPPTKQPMLISVNGTGSNSILQFLHDHRWCLLLDAPELGLYSDLWLRETPTRRRRGHRKRHMDHCWTDHHRGPRNDHGNGTAINSDDLVFALGSDFIRRGRGQ